MKKQRAQILLHRLCEGKIAGFDLELLTKTLECTQAPVIIYDKNYLVHYINQAFEELTGFSSAHNTENTVQLYLHQLSYKQHEEKLIDNPHLLIQFTRKDGTHFWARESTSTILSYDSQEIFFVKVLYNATEVKPTENVGMTAIPIYVSPKKTLAVKEIEAIISSVENYSRYSQELTLKSLSAALDARDKYTAGHSLRVAEIALLMARTLNIFSDEELQTLELGCVLHDIGKIGIPEDILFKAENLSKAEFEIIKQHPIIGYEILKNSVYFEQILPIVRSHHERLNGTGYPDGLSGDEIPTLVRITSIADVYDAMTSNRVYRSGLSSERALSTMEEEVKRGYWDIEIFRVLSSLCGNGTIKSNIELGTHAEDQDIAA